MFSEQLMLSLTMIVKHLYSMFDDDIVWCLMYWCCCIVAMISIGPTIDCVFVFLYRICCLIYRVCLLLRPNDPRPTLVWSTWTLFVYRTTRVYLYAMFRTIFSNRYVADVRSICEKLVSQPDYHSNSPSNEFDCFFIVTIL